MTRIVYIIILSVILYSCHKEDPSFIGTYFSAEDESFWKIELLNDSTFKYQTKGHIGNSTTVGTLTFEGDTIYLRPESGQAFTKRIGFLYYQDSCLIELEYWIDDSNKVSKDYCKGRENNWTSNYWNLETMSPILSN